MTQENKEQPRSNEEIGAEVFNKISDIEKDYRELLKTNPNQAQTIRLALGDFGENLTMGDLLRFKGRWINLLNGVLRLDELVTIPSNNVSLSTDTYYFLSNRGTLNIRVDNLATRYNDNGSVTHPFAYSRDMNISENDYLAFEKYSDELEERYNSLKIRSNEQPF